MSFIDALKKAITPSDTEEIKPNLFIQKKLGGHRQVYPAVWNMEFRWKNMFFGGSPLKSTIFFAIILFIVWSYNYEIAEYKAFYEEVYNDPVLFCTKASVDLLAAVECTKARQEQGLCSVMPDLDLGNITFPDNDG